jgi:hypothetical protein
LALALEPCTKPITSHIDDNDNIDDSRNATTTEHLVTEAVLSDATKHHMVAKAEELATEAKITETTFASVAPAVAEEARVVKTATKKTILGSVA